MKRIGFVALVLIVVMLVFAPVFIRGPVHAQMAASTGFSYTNITSNTNTSMKTAPGQFHGIMINGGTLTGTLTIVDTSTADCSSGTSIGVIAANQTPGQFYQYDLQVIKGLCITTSAAVNATVMWR